MSGLIILSQNSPLRASGEPSKTRPSTQPGPASTRQNGAFCLNLLPIESWFRLSTLNVRDPSIATAPQQLYHITFLILDKLDLGSPI
jgi:hypothetical protein